MNNDIYIQVLNAIRNHFSHLVIKDKISPHDLHDTIRRVLRKHPELFWFSNQYHFDEDMATIHFRYLFSMERTRSIQRSIDDVVANDFNLEFVKRLTKWEQIAYVYKWLVIYCNYNVNSVYNQGIYSVFVRRNSVCTGYAKAVQYLLGLLGIKSQLVFGKLNGDKKEEGRHCWNLVKIEGKYYHFDVCFGDEVLNEVAKMAGVVEFYEINRINYNFFGVSTQEISKTRSIEEVAMLPPCKDSLPYHIVAFLAQINIKRRKDIKGCLLTQIGSSADIYLCSQDKHTVLKVFRPYSQALCTEEYHYMQHLEGCAHILQCKERYSDIENNIIAIEQATPIIDLLYDNLVELSLQSLLKMVDDITCAWIECRSRGVLYRDIHICNIYHADDGIFKFGDFGSCTEDFSAKNREGSQWFMAPETVIYGKFTESSAIYSIAMILYFILNYYRPAFWTQGHEEKALNRRLRGEELPLPLACNNLPTDEDMIPLPNDEATPPVTKIYFVSPTIILFF